MIRPFDASEGSPRRPPACPRACKADPQAGFSFCLLVVVALTSAILSEGFLLPDRLAGQTYNVHQYTNADGLPQQQVLSLHQSPDGYLWLGTYGGLARYDGSRFVSYTTTDGLSSNVVDAIAETSDGRLHLGTLGGGVCHQEEEGFRCRSADDGMPSEDVTDLLATEEGTVWAATENGLTRLDGDGGITVYTVDEGLPSASIHSLAKDDSGRLWVGTSGGLAARDGDEFRAAMPETFSGEAVQMLLPLPSGLLVGTDATLYLLEGENAASEGEAVELRILDPPELPPDAGFNDAAQDSEGRAWIATDGGLLRFDGEEFRHLTEANGLATDEIQRVMVDREENVWMGGDVGAGKLVPGPFRSYSDSEGLPHPFGRAVAEDHDGRLWVGTRHGAAARDSAEDRFVVTVPGDELPTPSIFSLAREPGGGMLVGTQQGLVHWSDGTWTLLGEEDGLPDPRVMGLLPEANGEGVWVGTGGGLARWRDGEIIPFPDDHPMVGPYILSLAYGDEGRLWAGRLAGGVRIWDGERAETLGAEEGLTDQVIWSLDRDEEGRMWVGTNGYGAFRVDGTEIQRYTTEEGLANDFVWQVLVDSQGSVWMYTSQGLSRFQDGSFRRYGKADGLAGLEGSATAALEDSEGRLWFGTSEGVLAYDPDDEHLNLVPPPVQIEEVVLGGEELDLGEELRFDSDLLQIRFSGLSFRDEDAVRYRYRLREGDTDDESWSDEVEDSGVSFAGLSPGRYAFEVTAINGDGVASAVPATLSFTVLPAFWQTWWFRLLGLALLVGVGATIPVARARKLDRERKRLESLVAERTGELESTNERLRSEIQERERAEKALRESENRLRVVVENSTNVFYSHTADHELTYVSPRIEDLLGISPDEAPERWTELATDDPVNQQAIEATERAIGTGERQPPFEVALRRSDGETVWVRVTESPVVEDGEVVGVVGSLTDITEARRAKEERRRMEEELHQAQKMEAVGRLAGGIAHDFNNLLTSIIGHANFVAMELGSDHPLTEDLSEVERACDRAADLVAQLLAFGRKQVLDPAPQDLNEVVEEGARMLDRMVGDDITTVVEPSTRDPWVLMDRSQLDQVVLNLVVNARDAMLEGGTLTITADVVELEERPDHWEEPDFTPGSYAVLRVTDTGAGMDAAIRERIFEPFFTTKEVGEGSGLGLATVYGIVKQNGGHVRVETEAGQGTTFSVYLPTAPRSEEEEGGLEAGFSTEGAE